MREGGQAREAPEYAPRRPETTILYRVVQHRLETWLGNARIHERTVPRFVERELRAFLVRPSAMGSDVLERVYTRSS